MRENRTYGSEGGVPRQRGIPTPIGFHQSGRRGKGQPRSCDFQSQFTDWKSVLVRQWSYLIRTVGVRLRHTLSGLKLKVTASPRGEVESNWR